MTKLTIFMIKAGNGKEAVMRLPVNRHGGITPKGFKMACARFYDTTNTDPRHNSLKYALNLEAYGSAQALMGALANYQKNII